jgi:hypothetical protein
MIPTETVEKIKAASRLEDVIPGLQKSGRSLYARCPKCGALDERKKKGLMLNPGRQIAKCFSCGFGVNNALTYLKEAEGMTYPQALEKLAGIHSIDIEAGDDWKERLEYERRLNERKRESFCDRQLTSSGLTPADVTPLVQDEQGSEREAVTFRSGTRDQYGNLQPGQGDDMLIYYYDLQGRQVMYRQEKGNRMKPLVRIRWQNPDLHLDKEGKPIKYESPYGSGSHVYIPERLRQTYRAGTPIDVLFLQEGEKKAEKATKHGLPSLGIMGIQNVGSRNHTLPTDLQLVVQKCAVRQVAFLLDADWDDVSDKLRPGDQVDQRPRSFFYAVRNFKEYMRTLVNLGISVEIWFGYVRKTASGAKGVDDLLVMELTGREEELQADILSAMHHKDGAGQWVQMHKITMMSDTQIADLWLLNDAEAFSRRHREKLKALAEFKIGKLKRRFDEEGKLQLAQPLLPSEQYWIEIPRATRDGEVRTELQFDYANCFTFLRNHGYGRCRMKSGQWDFVRIENRVVSKVDNYDIKDYVTEYTKEIKRKDVLNMLYRGGPQYLGHEKLSNLDFVTLSIEKATRDSQCLFFREAIWKVTADGIEQLTYPEFKNHVWEDKIIAAKVSYLGPLVDVRVMDAEFRCQVRDPDYKDIPDGEFFYDITPEGEKCHFLRFLENASNFKWRKLRKLKEAMEAGQEPGEDERISPEEWLHDSSHLINKLTSVGYLLHDYKNDSELKAVIGMDGKLSEVGISNGRTGKSLVGKALEYVIPQVYIPAKSKKITEDNFLFGEVTEKHKNIFLDDTRANIDFEFFFPLITGKLKVNPKGAQPFTLEQDDTPKLYITTNHAINGEGASFRDRQAFMAFSDYYNDAHKPVDDFGINFFSEWDNDQWNLFYNLMATCLQLYFRSIREGWAGNNAGIVEPPMESITRRHLRQMIGEDFLQWADAAFTCHPDGTPTLGSRLNQQQVRKELFDHFMEEFPHARKYVTSTSFGKRMRHYCLFRGFHFNPAKPNEDGVDFFTWTRLNPEGLFEGQADKTGGKEYWTIATAKWTGIL